MSFMDAVRERDIDLGDLWDNHRGKLMAGAGALVLAGALWGVGYWWFAVRWKAPPSIFDAPVDGVLSYLTTPDFNALPMRERMKYVQEFVARFRGMSQQDSVVAAAFLAGVSGKVREQLTQNVRILAKDILAEGAATYVNLPESERGAFIDKWIADWVRTAEAMATGEDSKRTDKEIVDNATAEAQRNEQNQSKRMAGRSLSERGADRFLSFWESEVEPAATPREMGQISRFMDDMRLHLLMKKK
jgi:hypothetical protein